MNDTPSVPTPLKARLMGGSESGTVTPDRGVPPPASHQLQRELRNCPFCGSPARWATSTEVDDWEIQCSNLDCPVIFIGGDHTGKELEAAWNTRKGQ